MNPLDDIKDYSDTIYTLMANSFFNEGKFDKPVTCSVSKAGILNVSVDTEWYDSADESAKAFFFCREGLRLLARHNVRKPEEKQLAKIWGLASDVVLDSLLNEYYFLEVPESEPLPFHIEYEGDLVVESVYQYLLDMLPDDPDGGEGGEGEDGEGKGKSKGDSKGKGKSKGSSGDGSDKDDDTEKDKGGSDSDKDDDDKKDDKGNGKGDKEEEEEDKSDSKESADDDVDEEGLDTLLEGSLKNVTSIDEEEAEEIDKISLSAGNGDSTLLLIAQAKKIVPKRKWETIVHEWASNALNSAPVETMAVVPKHLTVILDQLNGRVEGKMNQPIILKEKIHVAFYADTSGSCVRYYQRFMDAALSLPEDKFDVKLYCFDTRVYPISRKEIVEKGQASMKGGGGTSFQPLINETVRIEREEGRRVVNFVITDAEFYDSYSLPEEGRFRWHFMLVDHSSPPPTGCRKYKLSEFE